MQDSGLNESIKAGQKFKSFTKELNEKRGPKNDDLIHMMLVSHLQVLQKQLPRKQK